MGVDFVRVDLVGGHPSDIATKFYTAFKRCENVILIIMINFQFYLTYSLA